MWLLQQQNTWQNERKHKRPRHPFDTMWSAEFLQPPLTPSQQPPRLSSNDEITLFKEHSLLGDAFDSWSRTEFQLQRQGRLIPLRPATHRLSSPEGHDRSSSPLPTFTLSPRRI